VARGPDVLAPGRSVASLRVPGSYIDEQFGATANVGGRFVRGSGTSQSTAEVSGAVALLLQNRPAMTPDQVKAVLRNTAQPLLASTATQGKGRVQVSTALTSPLPLAAQLFARSTGTGSIDAARGGFRVESNGVQLVGEKDVFGKALTTTTLAAKTLTGSSWSGGSWNGSTMTGTGFVGGTWVGVTWSGTNWAGQAWSATSSTGAVWDGRSWAGGYWAGRSWAGRSWAGRSWASGEWG
jgi:serine protease AprX